MQTDPWRNSPGTQLKQVVAVAPEQVAHVGSQRFSTMNKLCIPQLFVAGLVEKVDPTAEKLTNKESVLWLTSIFLLEKQSEPVKQPVIVAELPAQEIGSAKVLTTVPTPSIIVLVMVLVVSPKRV